MSRTIGIELCSQLFLDVICMTVRFLFKPPSWILRPRVTFWKLCLCCVFSKERFISPNLHYMYHNDKSIKWLRFEVCYSCVICLLLWYIIIIYVYSVLRIRLIVLELTPMQSNTSPRIMFYKLQPYNYHVTAVRGAI